MEKTTANRTIGLSGTLNDAVSGGIAYASDYSAFLRFGTVSNALSQKTDSVGGYLVSEKLSALIAEKLAALNVLRRIGRIIKTSGTTRVPIAVGGIDGYWVPEEGQLTLSQPEFSSCTFQAYKLAAMVLVTRELLHDSAFDLEDLLARNIAERFHQQEESAFLSGDGQDKPTGLLSQIETGAETTDEGSITMTDIIALLRSVASDYRKNGSLLMNDNTFLDLFMASDYDHSVWSPGKKTGERMRLLGYPVFTTDSLPEAESGEKPVLFGDFSYFWIAERSQISIHRLDEKYAQYGQVGFLATERIDARLILPDAIKALEVS